MQGATETRLLSRNKLAPPEMSALQASPDNYYIILFLHMTTLITEDQINYLSSIFQTKKQRWILDAYKTTLVYLGVQAHLGRQQLKKQ